MTYNPGVFSRSSLGTVWSKATKQKNHFESFFIEIRTKIK
jgi:hypothetical protein